MVLCEAKNFLCQKKLYTQKPAIIFVLYKVASDQSKKLFSNSEKCSTKFIGENFLFLYFTKFFNQLRSSTLTKKYSKNLHCCEAIHFFK